MLLMYVVLQLYLLGFQRTQDLDLGLGTWDLGPRTCLVSWDFGLKDLELWRLELGLGTFDLGLETSKGEWKPKWERKEM